MTVKHVCDVLGQPTTARKTLLIVLLVFSGILLAMMCFPEYAFATGGREDVVSKITALFKKKSDSWMAAMTIAALWIFKWFAIFEVCMLGTRVGLGQENIGSAIKQFVMFLLMAGFFYVVIQNYNEWSWNLINGLKQLGDQLGAPSTISEAPFKAGLELVRDIIKKAGEAPWTQFLGFIIAALVVLICFSLIAARMILIKCEAMVSMAAALLLVGFGGSSVTKDYAINTIRYVLSVAFKLFVMQLVIAVGIDIIKEYQVTTAQFQDLVVVIGASVIIYALVLTLPDAVAGIINGSHIGSGAGLGGAAGGLGRAIGGAAVGAAVGVGGAMAAGSAMSSASKLAGLAGATGLGKVGHMAKSLMSAGDEAKKTGGSRSSIMKERLEAAMQKTNKDA